MKRSPTIGDVAKLAGVSPTTVSFVLNDVGGSSVSARTRERVRRSVQDLGYRPNVAAKLLRASRSHTIGFVTDEIASTPFASGIIEGAQDMAWENGKILMIVNTGRNRKMEERAAEMMLERRVESIIYATMFHRAVEPPKGFREVPAILLDCYSEEGHWPSVVPDEVSGGRTATEALLVKGHERIGFINLPSGSPAAEGRLEGYAQALEARRLVFDASLVKCGDGRSSGGYSGALELMLAADPPTAIFCGNDPTAMGAYEALKELGLYIPQDVAVVGFDNQALIADQLRPPLSTVALPHYEMGRWAVNYLIKHAGAGETPPIRSTLDCVYVERESV
ncbi:MAG: LacI family DNA-binding transcriptional regulator [Rubrobacteraceae bacterium]